ncbi:MAG TPA: hypothetical protein VL943_00610, partial [Niabella sp.]|nr:hypothetical protein [Niabella sp.]
MSDNRPTLWNIKRAFFYVILVHWSVALHGRQMEEVFPGVFRITVGKPATFTPVGIAASKPSVAALQMLPPGRLPFNLSDVQITVNERGVKVSIPLGDNEQLYGFGLQIGSFNQNGLRKVPIVNDYPLNNLGYTHAPLPYYVSNRGYAVLVNTARYCTFYCGGNRPKDNNSDQEKRSTAVKLSVDDLYRSDRQPSGDVLVDIPNVKGIEVYIFSGR